MADVRPSRGGEVVLYRARGGLGGDGGVPGQAADGQCLLAYVVEGDKLRLKVNRAFWRQRRANLSGEVNGNGPL